MNTTNLNKVRSVRNPSPLQFAVLYLGDEQSSLEDLLDAERAAAELVAMQARIDAAEKMAECLRDLRKASYFTAKDAAALEAWEALK